jgi:hypothetical protein
LSRSLIVLDVGFAGPESAQFCRVFLPVRKRERTLLDIPSKTPDFPELVVFDEASGVQPSLKESNRAEKASVFSMPQMSVKLLQEEGPTGRYVAGNRIFSLTPKWGKACNTQ